MHSSQRSKNENIREGRDLLAVCPSLFHIRNSKRISINLYAPWILYIGQTYCFSPQYASYIFSQ